MQVRLRRVLKFDAGRGRWYEAQFIDDQQLTAGDVFLEAQEELFSLRVSQRTITAGRANSCLVLDSMVVFFVARNL
jgi:hypothetical protein